MTQFVDISVRDFTGDFTRKAKAFNVKTQILMKIPAWSLTSVRLIGTLFEISEFLRSMPSRFEERAVQMHVNAVKPLLEQAPHWKNRALMENRSAKN